MIICEVCGAEAEGGPTCPRCGAVLPADRWAKSLRLASLVIAACCAASAAAALVVDYAMSGGFGWSLIGAASSLLGWLLIGFPMLAYRRPDVFLPAMAAAALAYLWALDRLTGATGWFFALALPIGLSAMASGALTTLLCLKARRRGPNIAAFILFGAALACLAIESVISLHFRASLTISWSGIVAASAVPVAVLLLGIQARLRQPSQAPLALERAAKSSIK
jgi:hypothetical protein